MFMLLAGGAYMGITEVQNRQTVEQQAAKGGGPGCKNKTKNNCSNAGCVNGQTCKWASGSCKEVSCDQPTDTGADPAQCTSSGGQWCNGCGGFCLKSTFTGGGCNQAQQEKCGEAAINCSLDLAFDCQKVDGTTGKCCPTDYEGKVPNPVFYYCSPNCYATSNAGGTGGPRCDSSVSCAKKVHNVPDCFNGVIQVDSTTAGNHMSFFNTCGEEETPSSSPSPSPSPSPTMACVDLTKGTTTPKKGDKVTFTCEGSMSGVSPVAFFRSSTDNGTTFGSAVPAGGVAVNASTKKASYDITIDTIGNWVVQCRVCTTAAAATCTAWGQAN